MKKGKGDWPVEFTLALIIFAYLWFMYELAVMAIRGG